MIAELLTALRTAFAGSDVTLYDTPPKQPVAPSVVVHPGNPFLEPREAGSSMIRERWVIRVVASGKDIATSVAQMRRNSLKVRRAVNAVGGVWTGASGPTRVASDSGDNTEFVFSANDIHFRYDANSVVTS